MGTPCERLSKEFYSATTLTKKVGLNAEPSNLAFVANQLLLAFKHSKLTYISIAEMVKPNVITIIKQLQQLWGTPQEFNTKPNGGSKRTRDFYTYPPITYNMEINKNNNNPKCKKCHTSTHQLSRQWTWPTPQQHHLEQPPTIKAITPRL